MKVPWLNKLIPRIEGREKLEKLVRVRRSCGHGSASVLVRGDAFFQD